MPTTCNSNSPILHHLRNPTYSSISIMGWCKDTHKYVPFCISEVIGPSSLATHSLNILTWNRFWYCQFHGGCNDGNFVRMLSTMRDVNCIIVTKNTTTTIQLMFSGHELYWVIIFSRRCVRDVSFFVVIVTITTTTIQLIFSWHELCGVIVQFFILLGCVTLSTWGSVLQWDCFVCAQFVTINVTVTVETA